MESSNTYADLARAASAAPASVKFRTLDGMRGVAAMAVVLFHQPEMFAIPLFANGYLAVDLFFALSAFVIAHAYNSKLSNGMTAWQFAKIRIVRLYPLYFLGLMCGLIIAIMLNVVGSDRAAGPAQLAGQLLAALLFLPYPFSPTMFPLNFPSWSLFYELAVNILFCAVFALLTPVVVYLIAALSLAAIVYLNVTSVENANTWMQGLPSGIARTIFSFCVGLIAYKHQTNTRVNPILLLAILAFILAVPVPDHYRDIFNLIMIGIAMPMLVLFGAATEPMRYTKAFDFLGLISFPLYVLHVPVLGTVLFASEILSVPFWALGAAMIVFLVCMRPIVVRFYENPARAILRRAFL